jgi:hypothetical protein
MKKLDQGDSILLTKMPPIRFGIDPQGHVFVGETYVVEKHIPYFDMLMIMGSDIILEKGEYKEVR